MSVFFYFLYYLSRDFMNARANFCMEIARIRYNTVASEYIPEKIGLGIEIMCLRAVRYRSDGRNRV